MTAVSSPLRNGNAVASKKRQQPPRWSRTTERGIRLVLCVGLSSVVFLNLTTHVPLLDQVLLYSNNNLDRATNSLTTTLSQNHNNNNNNLRHNDKTLAQQPPSKEADKAAVPHSNSNREEHNTKVLGVVVSLDDLNNDDLKDEGVHLSNNKKNNDDDDDNLQDRGAADDDDNLVQARQSMAGIPPKKQKTIHDDDDDKLEERGDLLSKREKGPLSLRTPRDDLHNLLLEKDDSPAGVSLDHFANMVDDKDDDNVKGHLEDDDDAVVKELESRIASKQKQEGGNQTIVSNSPLGNNITNLSDYAQYNPDNWPIVPVNQGAPYREMTPHLDLIWSRGWYNVELPPPDTVPLSYYNERGRQDSPSASPDLKKYWNVDKLCGPQPAFGYEGFNRSAWNQALKDGNTSQLEGYPHRPKTRHAYLWVRGHDLTPLTRVQFVPWCNLTLITSNCIKDMPGPLSKTPLYRELLLSPNRSIFHAWYTQNLVLPGSREALLDLPGVLTLQGQHAQRLPEPRYRTLPADTKLFPIPVGLPLHYGLPGSPHTLDTAAQLAQRRQSLPPFATRNTTLLLDVGTTSGRRRRQARLWLRFTAKQCNLTEMPKLTTDLAWHEYASHHFAPAPTGTGRDTYRLWELIFFGTVPIVHSADGIDVLVLPAHVPVLIVDDWLEVCELQHNATLYQQMVERYQDWIHPNVTHFWLKPGTWIPRNQSGMDAVCQQIPGCVEAAGMDHRMYPRNITAAKLQAVERQAPHAGFLKKAGEPLNIKKSAKYKERMEQIRQKKHLQKTHEQQQSLTRRQRLLQQAAALRRQHDAAEEDEDTLEQLVARQGETDAQPRHVLRDRPLHPPRGSHGSHSDETGQAAALQRKFLKRFAARGADDEDPSLSLKERLVKRWRSVEAAAAQEQQQAAAQQDDARLLPALQQPADMETLR